MEKTSSGFHTITIVKKLTKKEASKLIADFQSYSTTNNIKFEQIHKSQSNDSSDEFIKWLQLSFSKYYIGYYPEGKGIRWLLTQLSHLKNSFEALLFLRSSYFQYRH